MVSLPLDIVADILRRLPVEDLLCLRCVSKPWCKLIDGPDFIKLHLDHSTKAGTNQSLILKHSKLHWVNLDSLEKASEIDHPLMSYNHGVKVLGSCNGLMCICNIVDDIAFWNPSTRKHRVVPYLSLELKRYSGSAVCSVSVHGFGYDEINDDYKLVRIAQFRGSESQFFESEVKVYSLNRNCWKRIADMPFMFRYPGKTGVCAGSALHWVVSTDADFEKYNVVVALNLADEDYKEVVLPEFADRNFNLEVAVLGGCLCVVANYANVRSDVWLMKEYGAKDSWTKLFSVLNEQVVGSLRSVRPLAYSKRSSEILFEQDRMNLCWYDLEEKRVKDARIRGWPFIYEVEFCLQTLVSFNVKKGSFRRNQKIDHEKNVKKRDDFLSVGFKLVL